MSLKLTGWLFLALIVLMCVLGVWVCCGPTHAADLGGPPPGTLLCTTPGPSPELAAVQTRIGNYARANGYRVASCEEVPVRSGPTFTGCLRLGGATGNPGNFSFGSSGTQTCPMGQLNVKIANLFGPIALTGEVRHAFCSSSKADLYNKSKYVAGLEVPVGKASNFFVSYERAYRDNTDWAWAGCTFNFGG